MAMCRSSVASRSPLLPWATCVFACVPLRFFTVGGASEKALVWCCVQSPQPVTPWTEPRVCTKQAHICPQLRITDFLYLGNEDCLYLVCHTHRLRLPPPNTT
jgi:hypothetical protein